MTTIAGPGTWLRTDALRLVIAACVPLALVAADATAAAVMLLVLGGAMLTRGANLSAPVDIATQLVLLAAAWFAALDLYAAIEGLDLVTHFAAGAVLALLARAMLLRARLLPDGVDGRSAVARALHVVTAVTALGFVWELAEWAGHVAVSSEINVGYEDTLGDLVADVLGAIVAVVAVELVALRRGTARRAPVARRSTREPRSRGRS